MPAHCGSRLMRAQVTQAARTPNFHKASMPVSSQEEDMGLRKHRTPIGKAISKLQLSSERLASSDKTV